MAKLIFQFLSNVLAIFIATKLIKGFNFSFTIEDLIFAAIILLLINLFLRPIIKLIFMPLIILTLGFFIIIINAFTLHILDLFVPSLTIEGYLSLLYSSLLIGFVNFLFSKSGKILNKND